MHSCSFRFHSRTTIRQWNAIQQKLKKKVEETESCGRGKHASSCHFVVHNANGKNANKYRGYIVTLILLKCRCFIILLVFAYYCAYFAMVSCIQILGWDPHEIIWKNDDFILFVAISMKISVAFALLHSWITINKQKWAQIWQ